MTSCLGFKDLEMTKLMVGNWYCTVRAFGRIIGSFVIGGIVLQQLKFYKTSLFLASILFSLTCLVFTIIIRLRFYRKIFYTIPANLLDVSTDEDQRGRTDDQDILEKLVTNSQDSGHDTSRCILERSSESEDNFSDVENLILSEPFSN